LAERICANAPVAVRQSLQLMAAAAPEEEPAWRLTDEAMAAVVASEDAGEGRAAFLEHRPPQWRGR
jgi:1,4-dihydroxy-2-naphthoyl-CoA synthase